MNQTFQCGDNTALVGYLYDECEPAERQAIEAHVDVCAACAAELAALGSTRLQLASWTPPEAELGFQVVRPQARAHRAEQESVLRPSVPWGLRPGPWFRQPLPAWAQAAAAFLIFAAGLWLGVERGSAPAGTAPAAATVASGSAVPANTATATDLAALEQRLRAEMAQVRTASSSAAGAPASTSSEAQLLARVRALIDESEQRQQRELAFRIGQVGRDFDTQRRADLATIQRTFGQMEGQTGAEVRDQRETLNYLMRVSQQQGR